MQSGWRLYAGMIALAALTGTIVALALSGGPRLPSESPRRTGASATATATATASPSVSRLPSSPSSPSPSATATPSPTPTANPSDPLSQVRPLVLAWRPKDTTAIVEKRTAAGSRLTAVPLDGTSATPLVDLPPGSDWAMRLDGTAIAATVPVRDGAFTRMRVAALNLQTGVLAWVTPDDAFATQLSPLWSNDGSVVYYTRASYDGAIDLGVYRVRVDGSNLTQLRAGSNDGAIRVRGITPDGLGLVLDRSVVSGYVDVLDLNTRAIRSFQTPQSLTGARASANVWSWRPQRPRALVGFGGPAGGPRVYVWDDLAPPASPSPLLPSSEVFGADWDATATRIVAAVAVPNSGTRLVTMSASGQDQQTLAGTDGASSPYWLRGGVVYLYAPGFSTPTEVRLAQPTGASSPKTLFRDSDLVRLTYVSP